MQRRRLVTAVAVSLVLVVAAASTAGRGFAGEGEDADLGLRQIAEQEPALTDDPMVWQVSELLVFSDEEHPIPFFAGFLSAHAAPLVLYRDGGTRTVRLTVDDAFPIEDGELLAPLVLRGDDATFLVLELVAEDDAFDPIGEPFEPEAGAYVLELLRAEFEGDEGVVLEPVELSELPVLLVVVAGEVEATIGDEEPEELNTGDVLTAEVEIALRRLGDEPAVVLAATLRHSKDDDEAAESDEDDANARDAGSTASADAGAGQGSSTGGGTGDTADLDPTPTPKPTEAPSEAPAGESPDSPSSGGTGDSGSGSGSGGVGVEEGPGDGECLYCAPADDGLLEEGGTGDPCLLADGGGDPDSDGLNNCAEAAAGTSSTVQDTDGDGAWDGDEVRTGTNPTKPDTDGDGL